MSTQLTSPEPSAEPNEPVMDGRLTAKFERACATDERLRPHWSGDSDADELIAASLASLGFSADEIVTVLRCAPYNAQREEKLDYWSWLAEKAIEEATAVNKKPAAKPIAEKIGLSEPVPARLSCADFPLALRIAERLRGLGPAGPADQVFAIGRSRLCQGPA